MPVCFVLPGLLGTSLGTGPFGILPLWIYYPRLVIGQVGALRLAPDGVNPGSPDGMLCTPAGPLEDYYGQAVRTLAEQLAGDGYTVSPWGYDWRRRAAGSGAALAADVRRYSSSTDPATIVGHSFGGLVARAAWADLVLSGHEHLVRRIVTIGTPHWGSYGAVSAWSGGSESISQMSLLTTFAEVIQQAVTPIPFTHAWTYEQIAALSATWPALYETLPVLDAPTSADDPLRSQLFDAARWPAALGISAQHLGACVASWQPFLHAPVSMPPPSVLTTVAGSGLGAYGTLRDVSQLGSLSALNLNRDGDGVVEIGSALLAGSAQLTVSARHVDLPLVVALSGQLAALVREVRVPPDPPPPPRITRTPIIPLMRVPPTQYLLWPDP